MKRKLVVFGSCVAALLCAAALGRFTAPKAKVEKFVEYKDRIVYRERSAYQKSEGPSRLRVVTRIVPGPRGPERIVERVLEKGPSITTRLQDKALSETLDSKERLVSTPQGPGLLLGPTLGLGRQGPSYGAQALKRVLGPFWLGIQVDTEPSARASVLVQF